MPPSSCSQTRQSVVFKYDLAIICKYVRNTGPLVRRQTQILRSSQRPESAVECVHSLLAASQFIPRYIPHFHVKK